MHITVLLCYYYSFVHFTIRFVLFLCIYLFVYSSTYVLTYIHLSIVYLYSQ